MFHSFTFIVVSHTVVNFSSQNASIYEVYCAINYFSMAGVQHSKDLYKSWHHNIIFALCFYDEIYDAVIVVILNAVWAGTSAAGGKKEIFLLDHASNCII